MPSESCQQAIHRFLTKDFSSWSGLPGDCDLDQVGAVVKLSGGTSRLDLGRDVIPTYHKAAAVDTYEEPIKVWHRGEQVVKISVEYPELPDVKGLLDALGEPDSKLDYYYSSVPMPNQGGEWVYARKGITLFMSSDKSNVVTLAVYPPTTPEDYERELYYWEAPREYP